MSRNIHMETVRIEGGNYQYGHRHDFLGIQCKEKQAKDGTLTNTNI